MNQKGFSLIELLAVIIILGIIATLGVLTYQGIDSSVNNAHYNNLITSIKSNAVEYATDNAVYKTSYITIADLIEKGYYESDNDENKVYDPRNKDNVLNCTILEVKYTNNGYNINVYEDKSDTELKTCENNIGKSQIYLIDIKKSNEILVEYDPNLEYTGSVSILPIISMISPNNQSYNFLLSDAEEYNNAKITYQTTNGYGPVTKTINNMEYLADIIFDYSNETDSKETFDLIITIENEEVTYSTRVEINVLPISLDS